MHIKGNRKRVFYFTSSVSIIIVFYIIAWLNAGKWLVKEDEPQQSDAIVILMGSIADRVMHAADLYEQDRTENIILVEESMGAYKLLEERGANIISNSCQVLNILVSFGVPDENIIILPGDATSTQMEAMVIREYLADKPDIDTLLLVTSASHSRRASMIFSTAFEKADLPVHVVSCPSEYSGFNASRWWRNKEDIQKVFMEYLKIGNFLVFERGEF